MDLVISLKLVSSPCWSSYSVPFLRVAADAGSTSSEVSLGVAGDIKGAKKRECLSSTLSVEAKKKVASVGVDPVTITVYAQH